MAATDAVVSNLVDKIVSTVQQQSELVSGELQKIISNLKYIQSRLIDAERRQWREENVRLWLDRLKSVAYEVDDAIDELIHEILKPQATIKVWCFNILSSCYCFQLRHQVAVKLRNLNARLDFLAVERERYCFQLLGGNYEQVKRDPTASDISISEVKGRKTEREELLNLLLAESSELPKIHPVSIAGMRGMGKTTLAKIVYHDETVKSHFEKRIWVCVSKGRIAKLVLESITGHNPNLVKLQSIAATIQRSIKGKKFLLVLDGVWNEDPMEWKELEDCLLGGSSGSKILATTSNERVAKAIKCISTNKIQLGLLPKEECWSLFCDIAFSRQSSNERESLETIGKEIVARCKGLPLAVKLIASVLRFKKSRDEWENVLHSELWELEVVEEYLLGPLLLSYDDLPSSLKLCLLCCALFPKGNKMSKYELSSLWMAHGFIKPTRGRDMEMVGNDYFHDLGKRSLLQDFEVKENFNGLDKTYCKMHDIVQDFAESMMRKECLYIDMNSPKEATSRFDVVGSDGIYHLHVKLGENFEFFDSIYNLRMLRSLFIMPLKNDSLVGAALPRIFHQLTSLRSLSLSRCRLERIPSNINKLIHLKWLKLSKNYALKELPKTICELYNLHTLSVNWCAGLTHFPRGVEKLTNLRHLKNNYTYFLLPKGIGKLSGLQKLSRVTIDPKFKDAFSLRDLKNLESISGSLTIFFVERECDTLVKDAYEANLKVKKKIIALNLNFPERAAEEWIQQEDEKLAEALKPPLSLEMLRITCYAGTNCPSWTNRLTSLKKLKLWYWSNCEHMPALAKLPCLEHIEFSNFVRVKKVTSEFYRAVNFMGPSLSMVPLFPKLKNLQFMNMTEWEEWSDYDRDEDVMPCLSYLSIENCPKLKALPNFISEKASLNKQIIR